MNLHYGSTISPFLFDITLNELSNLFAKVFLSACYFLYDVMLVGETKEKVNERLRDWQVTLKRKELQISPSKQNTKMQFELEIISGRISCDCWRRSCCVNDHI